MVCALGLTACGTEAPREGAASARADVRVQELRSLGLGARLTATPERVTLPTRSAEPLVLGDARSGLSVAAHPLIREETSADSDVPLEEVGGLRHLRLGESSWVLGGRAGGAEDFLRVPRARSSVSAPEGSEVVVRYRLELSGVAGLRLVGGVLEFLDAQGAPRWRVRAPFAVDSLKQKLPLSVALEGCHADTSEEPPWRRPVTAPGSDTCVLRLGFDAQARFPVWVDPEWTTTESMAVPRARFISFRTQTPVGLSVAGGVDDQGNPLGSTESFDVETRSWSVLEPLRGARVDPLVREDYAFRYLLGGASVVERQPYVGGSWEAVSLTRNLLGCIASVEGPAGKSYPVFIGATSEADELVRVEYQNLDGDWVEAQANNAPGFRAEAMCVGHGPGEGGVLWFGGRLGTGEFPTTTWVLEADPSLTAEEQLARVLWSPGPDAAALYPQGVVGAAQWGDTVFGGEGQDGVPLDTVIEVKSVSLDFDLKALPRLPEALSRPSVVAWENGLFVAGGRNASDAASRTVYRSLGASWDAVAQLKEGRYSARLEELQRLDSGGARRSAGLVMLGGVGDNGVLGSVEYLTGQLGESCSSASDCWSGFCSHGVCCREACEGDCVTCAPDANHDRGECYDVPAGQPSPRGCEDPIPNPCGRLNVCDGAGRCMMVPEGTDCGSSCADGVEDHRACNGIGACYSSYVHCAGGCDGDHCTSATCGSLECAEGYVCERGRCELEPAGPFPCGYCGRYACDDTQGECKTSCYAAKDCAEGYLCRKSTHVCEPAPPAEPTCSCRTPGSRLSHHRAASCFAAFAFVGAGFRRRRARRELRRRS